MRIMVLGGDGFCGWPTALQLSKNHDVLIIDNLSRRMIDSQLGTKSLTPIASMEERTECARKLGHSISFVELNILDYALLVREIKKFSPDVIVHFGEQRAAPYSMYGEQGRRYTVNNNINATHNVLSAIVDCDANIRLVHLGTMGVYGYNKEFGKIPEGYLNVKVNSTQNDTDILYPTNPGSVYHMTKSMDQLMFQFYNKNWGIKITDLHQGIVWGTQTALCSRDSTLVNRFDYDGMYGTVLNRFIVQSAMKHPLTVYGTGEQTRAFIHIEDTARCVEIAVENDHDDSKVRIFNQVAETHRLIDLANMCSELSESEVSFLDNPRKEAAGNDLSVENEGLTSLGFNPILLSQKLVEDVKFIAEQLGENFDNDKVLNSPKW